MRLKCFKKKKKFTLNFYCNLNSKSPGKMSGRHTESIYHLQLFILHRVFCGLVAGLALKKE